MASPIKEKFVENLIQELKASEHIVVTEYQGMTAGEFDALRAALRPLGAKYKVVKNRLAKIALDASGFSDLKSYMKGPAAITYQGTDPSAIATALFKFSETHTNLKVKAGRLFNTTSDSKGLKAIASLPPRNVLLATLLARMNGPLQSLVMVLNEPLRSLHAALSAVQKKKESVAA